jgi:hypothetical protein
MPRERHVGRRLFRRSRWERKWQGVITSREVGPKDWTKPDTWHVIEGLLR